MDPLGPYSVTPYPQSGGTGFGSGSRRSETQLSGCNSSGESTGGPGDPAHLSTNAVKSVRTRYSQTVCQSIHLTFLESTAFDYFVSGILAGRFCAFDKVAPQNHD
jgi:hypothetical protein